MFKRILVAFFVFLIVLAGSAWLYLDRQRPMIDGTIKMPKISHETRIVRDKWGVPHIRARTGADAYFALGFTLAQDRLFQMELQRRLARGELAEILGPKLVDVDKKFRTLMLRHRAQAYLDKEGLIHPDALKFLDAFLEGINHFIATEPLPLEYTLLGCRPRPFTRLDTVSVLGYVAYSFADGVKRDSLYTILAPHFSRQDLDLIFPEYARTNRVTIMEPQGILPKPFASGARFDPSSLSPDEFTGFLASYQGLLDMAKGIVPPFTGSNSWVLAPSRTTSGHAILANDPHIGIANPGVWYEAHLAFPGYENYGYHLPLVPFPLLAHNKTKAWALTMFENDDLDLYAETFDPKDPSRVKYRGEWVKARIRHETIRVKGAGEVDLTIRVTPHGPVISDFLNGYKGRPVAVSWVYHKLDNPILDVIFDMGRAGTMAEFRTALSRLAAPGLNISYIDRSGNIGWWAAGRLPVRPPHVSGKQIHDGSSGRDECLGYLPFEKNPRMENPENGMIITANNLSTMAPIPPIGRLTGYFRPSDRAARIYELLSQKEKWDMEGLKKIQTDSRLYSGPEMSQAILTVLAPEKPNFTEIQARAFNAMRSWDGFMEISTIGGTVFQFTTYHILKQALEPHMGPDNFKAYMNLVDHWSFLKEFLGFKRTLKGKDLKAKSSDALILAGFKAAVSELADKHGSDPDKWNWGKIHTIEFVHPLGRKKPLHLLYNLGPFPSPAAFTSVNKLKSRIGNHDYRVASIPSTRRLIDCNDPENSWSILPTGNSGNFMSPFYDDQAQMFITGEHRKILYGEDQYLTDQARVLILVPE